MIHYADVTSAIGRRQFREDLEANLQGRATFHAFGVMCPALMSSFIEELDLEELAMDTETIPRDAVAVFRRKP